ncbi:MAG: hypothetical protein D8M58_20140 [Calditrichaeota bacterium]|nr:MAG: hypothetical protein DWQ03_14125 [Calditrichota bacterium]MBL1207721.1 hypothetical protein [Calditrichota bacterium]
MNNSLRSCQIIVFIFILGLFLFNQPIISIFTNNNSLFNFPVILLYLFSIWGFFILLMALLAIFLNKQTDSNSNNQD